MRGFSGKWSGWRHVALATWIGGLLCAGCFSSPQADKVKCTGPGTCPDGYQCLIERGQAYGRCLGAGTAGHDASLALDGLSPISDVSAEQPLGPSEGGRPDLGGLDSGAGMELDGAGTTLEAGGGGTGGSLGFDSGIDRAMDGPELGGSGGAGGAVADVPLNADGPLVADDSQRADVPLGSGGVVGVGGTNGAGDVGAGGAPGAGGATGTGGSGSSGGVLGTGGVTSTGGVLGTGGVISTGGELGTGGSSASTGGSSAVGGSSASGGSASTGGSSAVGGSSASGGSGATCDLPSTFKWTGDGPVVQPKSGWVSIKAPTHVIYNNKHVIYFTTHDNANWGSGMMTFDSWTEAATATQTQTSFGVSPTLFYFTPKKLWVIAYQWGTSKFNYRTSTDPTDPNGWGAAQVLYSTALPSGGTGPVDQTIICNTTTCFLYYAGDNGHIYKSSMPIESFPGTFPAGQDSGIVGTSSNLFESVQVYTLMGSNKYLMLVEAQGAARYFRAWTATDLDGTWTLLTDNFAIKANVTFSTNWTNDIGHGDLIRTNPDETFTVDPCNLQFLFQGRDPNSPVDYALLPYRLGLLTLVR